MKPLKLSFCDYFLFENSNFLNFFKKTLENICKRLRNGKCKNGVDIKYTITSQEEYEIIQGLSNLNQSELIEINHLVQKLQQRNWDNS